MDEHDDRPFALLADEAAHSRGLEPAARGAVDVDHVRDLRLHRGIITASSANRHGADPPCAPGQVRIESPASAEGRAGEVGTVGARKPWEIWPSLRQLARALRGETHARQLPLRPASQATRTRDRRHLGCRARGARLSHAHRTSVGADDHVRFSGRGDVHRPAGCHGRARGCVRIAREQQRGVPVWLRWPRRPGQRDTRGRPRPAALRRGRGPWHFFVQRRGAPGPRSAEDGCFRRSLVSRRRWRWGRGLRCPSPPGRSECVLPASVATFALLTRDRRRRRRRRRRVEHR